MIGGMNLAEHATLKNHQIVTRYILENQMFAEIALGNVYGHSIYHDGVYIHTSPIVSKENNVILTQSGNYYTLE